MGTKKCVYERMSLVISSVHSSEKFTLGSSLSASDRLREYIESP